MDRENRNRKSWYSALGSFLARRWAGLLLFLAFAGIFALVFSLYDLELEAVLYAGGLCLLLLLAVLAADFCRRLSRWPSGLRKATCFPNSLGFSNGQ